MRNMSFMLTTQQVKNKSKTVTRRNGWLFLKVGDFVQPVEKSQGLKKGEKIKKIGPPIHILKVNREPLNAITKEDCIKEGFPKMESKDFISMYSKHNKCDESAEITRIEYEYMPF